VADEGTSGVAGSKLPEPEGLVPGRGESVCTVRRDDLYSISGKWQPKQDVHTQSETIWEWPCRLRFG
jgi:hypothetical protein